MSPKQFWCPLLLLAIIVNCKFVDCSKGDPCRTPKENLEVIIDGVPLDAPLPTPEPELAAKAGLLPTPTSVTPALLPTPDDPEKKVCNWFHDLSFVHRSFFDCSR